MVRLPPIPPDQLNEAQRALYERNRQQISEGFNAFKTARTDGALLGPWGIFLYEPAVGQAHYDQIAEVTKLKRIPEAAKQIAILVVGARFRAAYELYAHCATAIDGGMAPAKVASLAAGGRPQDLSEDESAAFDVAHALAFGGVLPDATYQNAIKRFGQGGVNELVFWVGMYAQVSITLNAFDVPSEQEYGR